MENTVLDTQGQLTVVSCQIWPKIEFIKALMHILITRKYRKDNSENNQKKVERQFSPIISLLWYILDVQWQITSIIGGLTWSKFELVLDFIHVLVTYKLKKDRINSN